MVKSMEKQVERTADLWPWDSQRDRGVLGGIITPDGTVNVTDTNGVTTSNAVVVNGGYIAED